VEIKCAHEKELANATIHEPTSEETHSKNCSTNWIPDVLLPNCLDERILPYLKTDDGKHLYDVPQRCWNPTLLPPILRQPHKNGRKGRGGLSLDAEEEEDTKPQNDEMMLARFFNVIMKAIPKAIDQLRDDLEAKALQKSVRRRTKSEKSYMPRTPIVPNRPRAQSQAKKAQEITAFSKRCWTGYFATRKLPGTPLAVKPDLVLLNNNRRGRAGSEPIAWNDVLVFCELSKLQIRPDFMDTLYAKAYAIYRAQLNRRFVFALSITDFHLRISTFDRSGVVHSLPYHIHESPVMLVRVLAGVVYFDLEHLGYDPTIVLNPRPLTSPEVISSIKVDDKIYHIIKLIFARATIRGRATTCWHVRDPDIFDDVDIDGERSKRPRFYVIKDTWSIVERSSTEERILNLLKDIRGVPKLVKAWDVRVSGSLDTTETRRNTLPPQINTSEIRLHRRLVLEPFAVPITYFSRRMELLECFMDVITGTYCRPRRSHSDVDYSLTAHGEVVARGILHCDISLNNIMVYYVSTANGIVARGLLIDYDYATKITEGSDRVAGRQDLTVSIFHLCYFTDPETDMMIFRVLWCSWQAISSCNTHGLGLHTNTPLPTTWSRLYTSSFTSA
jgi:hypothetical protein